MTTDGETIQEQSGEVTTGVEVSGQEPSAEDKVVGALKELESMKKSISAFQSEKDIAVRERDEARRKIKALERTIDGVKNKMGEDSEFSTILDSEKQRSELSFYKSKEAEEQARLEQQRQSAEFVAITKEMIVDMGVDPNNPALDEAAKGAISPADLQRKLLAKAKELSKGGASKSWKDEMLNAISDMESRLRKDLGLETEQGAPQVSSGSKRLTRTELRNYDPTGKTPQDMKKDVDAMLDQITK